MKIVHPRKREREREYCAIIMVMDIDRLGCMHARDKISDPEKVRKIEAAGGCALKTERYTHTPPTGPICIPSQ